MIEPRRIKEVSKEYEDQNIRFRTFLKSHANSDELDAHFLRLHNEFFAEYDCRKCNNCCKEYDTFLGDDEIEAISKFLGQARDSFIHDYLVGTEEGFMIKGKPCHFLCADGQCRIQECKPSACRDFPFTNQPDRLFSLLGILEFAEICPVVFEILERLKKIYRFRVK